VLQDEYGFPLADVEAVDVRVRTEVDAATDEAERSPFPEPRDCLLGIYAEPPAAPILWYREGIRSAVDANERPEGWGTYHGR
jgi:TPP-dependent pyruvate/acetoin dehydrogenase alpha subunit